MPKRLRLDEVREACATVDLSTVLGSFGAFELTAYDRHGSGLTFSTLHGAKVVRIAAGYWLPQAVYDLPGSMGAQGTRFVGIGDGWVLEVRKADRLEDPPDDPLFVTGGFAFWRTGHVDAAGEPVLIGVHDDCDFAVEGNASGWHVTDCADGSGQPGQVYVDRARACEAAWVAQVQALRGSDD